MSKDAVVEKEKMDIESIANDLYLAWEQIFTDLKEVCERYVHALDNDAEVKCLLLEKGLKPSFLADAERVGRGLLDHRLLLESKPTFKKLAMCPLSEQQEALKNGIRVVVRNGDVLKVPAFALTPDQANQVFDKDRIRTEPEQKAYLETNAQREDRKFSRTATNKPYKFFKSGIKVAGMIIPIEEIKAFYGITD
jgi:hypothetical protein